MGDAMTTTQPQQAIQKKGPVQTLADMLNRESTKAAMGALVPKHMTPERLVKVALNCVAKTPRLQECSISSIYQSIVTATELGLEPGGAMGHAYLIPRKINGTMTCTFQIGYRGLLELIRRSGDLSNIRAVIVRKGDRFEYEEGLKPTLTHKPIVGNDGPMELVYAVATLKDGSQQFEVMSRNQIEKIRDRAGPLDFSPWKTDFDEMARKTAIRRISKMLPMSSEVADAIEKDGDAIDGEFSVDMAPDEESPAKKATKRKLNYVDAPEAPPAEESKPTEPQQETTPF